MKDLIIVLLVAVVVVLLTILGNAGDAYNKGYEAGCQSVLDELHAKTDSLIMETDSLLFPDNTAYEAWMEEMLRRKNKEK